jgi:hypothetical protein
VDSAGATIDGKVACLDAWRGFFAAFPDYRNVFEELRRTGEGWCSFADVPFAVSMDLMDRPSGTSSFETRAWTNGRSPNRRDSL